MEQNATNSASATALFPVARLSVKKKISMSTYNPFKVLHCCNSYLNYFDIIKKLHFHTKQHVIGVQQLLFLSHVNVSSHLTPFKRCMLVVYVSDRVCVCVCVCMLVL